MLKFIGDKLTCFVIKMPPIKFSISKGQGILIIPEKSVPEFKKLLVKYYENDDLNEILLFMKKECRKNFE